MRNWRASCSLARAAVQQAAEAAGRVASAVRPAVLGMKRHGITRGRSLAAIRWAAFPCGRVGT
jgi:hypothetical protein